jgi:transcriptional regulator NrdR family protein
MTCPVCGGKTTVYDTLSDVDSVVRKRKCCDCKYFVYTMELEYENAYEDFKLLARERSKKRAYRKWKGGNEK